MCRTTFRRFALSFGILALISGLWLQSTTLAQSGEPAVAELPQASPDTQPAPDPTRRGNRPIVTIDRADYQPGDTVVIEGTGFAPGEIVTLQVLHADGTDQGGEGHEPWSINADATGGIATTWYVNPDDSLGATFQLTVASEAGTYHVAVFTDGNFTHTAHAYHTGWYDGDFSGNPVNGNDPQIKNYFTGLFKNRPARRSFFAFHLPALPGRVTGATFSAVNNGGQKEGGGGDGEYVLLILNDVTVPIAVLNAGGKNKAVYTDLAVGTRYAEVYQFDPNESPVTAELGCAAIENIQAALGQDFAIAGWVPGLGHNENHFLFGNSGDPNGVLLNINYSTDLMPTTLTTSNLSVTYGPNAVTLQATLTPSQGCALKGRPIHFWIDGSYIGEATTDANGTAKLTSVSVASLQHGIHQIFAKFLGEGLLQSSEAVATLTVHKYTPRFTITVPGTQPFVYNGQSHAANVFVTGAFGEPLPVQSVDYQGNGFTPPSLPGTYVISAIYSPNVFPSNNNYNFAQDTSKSIVINPAPTTTTIQTSPNPSTFGQSVTITASVSSVGGTPPGTINIFNNFGHFIASVANGGSFTTKNLPVGGSQLTASYQGASINGRTTFLGSSGFKFHTMNKATPTIAVVAAPTPSAFGQPATFTATIGGVASAPAQPQFGGVSYFDGGPPGIGSPFGAAGVGSNGIAVFSTSNLATGTHTITATYSGDQNYGPASVDFSHTVTKAETTTVVTSASEPAAFGEKVSFTVTASAMAPGGGTPTGGTANLFVDGNLAGSGALVNGSVVIDVLNGSVLSPGAHQVTAEFLGSANHNGSTSAPITQHVSKAATSTTLSSGTNPSTYGQQVIFTATVQAPGLPGVAATGTVTFTDGTTDLGTGTIVDGVATFATTALFAATHHITAVYGGDARMFESQSTDLPQVVTQATASVTVAGYTGVFDGHAHGASGSANGVNGEDLSSLLDFGSTFTSVPGGTAHWTFAGDTNYVSSSGEATIAITQADAQIAVNGFSGAYDGHAHGATGAAIGANGEDLSGLLNLGANFTDVPGGTAHWTFAGNTNYAPAGGDAAIAITPRPVTIAADAVTKLQGAADPPLTYHITSGSLVGGAVFTGMLTRAPGEAVGSYPIIQGTVGLNSNYALSYVGATLTIRYDTCLLYDASKVHKSGSTIPIKLQLCSASGENLSSEQLIVHAVGVSLVSSSTSGTPEDAGNANPDGDFRVVGPPVSYMFNLKTTGLSPGTYHLTFTAGGGPTEYVVPFQIR